jgi:hypothetical protein
MIFDLEISQIVQPVTSALIVTRLAVPIRHVMGYARVAAVVGDVCIPVPQNLYRELQFRGPELQFQGPVHQNLHRELQFRGPVHQNLYWLPQYQSLLVHQTCTKSSRRAKATTSTRA